MQWQVKFLPGTHKIFADLCFQQFKMGMLPFYELLPAEGFYSFHDGIYTLPVLEVEQADALIAGANTHFPNGGIYVFQEDH